MSHARLVRMAHQLVKMLPAPLIRTTYGTCNLMLYDAHVVLAHSLVCHQVGALSSGSRQRRLQQRGCREHHIRRVQRRARAVLELEAPASGRNSKSVEMRCQSGAVQTAAAAG